MLSFCPTRLEKPYKSNHKCLFNRYILVPYTKHPGLLTTSTGCPAESCLIPDSLLHTISRSVSYRMFSPHGKDSIVIGRVRRSSQARPIPAGLTLLPFIFWSTTSNAQTTKSLAQIIGQTASLLRCFYALKNRRFLRTIEMVL